MKGLDKFTDDQYEECGVLIGKMMGKNYVINEVRKVPHRSVDPVNHFRVFASDVDLVLDDIADTDLHIVGFLHTHPQPEDSPDPSLHDIASLKNPTLLGAVYHPATKTLTFFDTGGVTLTTVR